LTSFHPSIILATNCAITGSFQYKEARAKEEETMQQGQNLNGNMEMRYVEQITNSQVGIKQEALHVIIDTCNVLQNSIIASSVY
jgi:hypothetical protein